MLQANMAPVEYTVYTFDLPSPSRHKGDVPWRRHFCSLDRTQALDVAHNLLRTRKYDRVEIKKKSYDIRRHTVVDKSYKIIRSRQAYPLFKKTLYGVIAVEICGLAAALLTMTI